MTEMNLQITPRFYAVGASSITLDMTLSAMKVDGGALSWKSTEWTCKDSGGGTYTVTPTGQTTATVSVPAGGSTALTYTIQARYHGGNSDFADVTSGWASGQYRAAPTVPPTIETPSVSIQQA